MPVGIEETRILYGALEDETPEAGFESGGGFESGAGRRDKTRPRAGTASPGRGLRRLTHVLTGIACGLVLVILAGTLYAVFRDSGGAPNPPEIANPGSGGAGSTAGPDQAAGTDPAARGPGARSPESAVFTGIGRLRITAGGAADSASRAVVVLSVVFPYPPGDRPFTEELAGKVPLFRRIIRDYFGGLSKDGLNPLDERRAKDELLRRFNAELQLGKIELLLFNELMILE
jgi:flagellar basal body-associated protein FliL